MLWSIDHGLRHRAIIAACTTALLVAAPLLPTAAHADNPWKVHEKLLGKPKDDGQDSKKSHDVSGVACATTSGFPRTCLLVDDETQGAQIVILKDGSLVAGDFIRLIPDAFDGELLELDGEGVAFADGAFYVVGSHGRPRHEAEALKQAANKEKTKAQADARTTATSKVFRIRFDPASVNDKGKLAATPKIDASTELPRFIKGEATLSPFFNHALDDNGLNIEGIAVRGDRIYFGMRGPVIENRDAAVLSVPLAALFDGAAGSGKLDRMELGKRRGIRDLSAFDGGFLLIAGPVNDPENGAVKTGDYSVFWWDGAKESKLLGDIEGFGDRIKPEGIVPIERKAGKLSVLVFFDGPEEGEPRLIEVKAP
jgi:Protein of unknown function (DUF3616)